MNSFSFWNWYKNEKMGNGRDAKILTFLEFEMELTQNLLMWLARYLDRAIKILDLFSV